jgi:hypothetical protein
LNLTTVICLRRAARRTVLFLLWSYQEANSLSVLTSRAPQFDAIVLGRPAHPFAVMRSALQLGGLPPLGRLLRRETPIWPFSHGLHLSTPQPTVFPTPFETIARPLQSVSY